MQLNSPKYIFVTGGVLSSLGKGISASSIATLLQASNLKVTILKIDPYINVDPGTMSPLEHGEVFVTSDGAETDLDIGHYERFLNTSLKRENNFTTGQIYLSVIENERKGKYLGKTIQVIPHIVDEIKQRIKMVARGYDFLVLELGGTVGDIEGMPYLEAMRQMKHELGMCNVISIHVTLIPYLKAAGELKTKPTQHSVQELRRIGINPQIILIRTEKPIDEELKKKIALSCDVSKESVIVAEDAVSIYACPLNFLKENILSPIAKHFNLPHLQPDMQNWDFLVKKIISPTKSIQIGFVGKYLGLKESYKSLTEALIHSGAHLDTKIEIIWIDSQNLDYAALCSVDGVLVPGGFGSRGIEGKIKAIQYAREKNIPFLGICLGMQLSIIEFLRNVCKVQADSTEFNPQTKEPAIYLIEDFIDHNGKYQIRTQQTPMGGTMRLGEYECELKKGSRIYHSYNKQDRIKERHRHRYEANPKYEPILKKFGMDVCARTQEGLIEAIEIPSHQFFVVVQFHPEFTSKLQMPNPIISSFVQNILQYKKEIL